MRCGEICQDALSCSTLLTEEMLGHQRMASIYCWEHLSLRGQDGDLINKRRDELYRLVKWENWSDVRGDELLEEWKVDEQEVLSWDRSDPELIGELV